MKNNFWNRIASILLVLVCVAGLAACGSGDVSGTYKLHTMEVAGMTLNWEQLAAAYAERSEEDFAINLILNADGTFKLDMLNMNTEESNASLEGTWEASGSTLKVTADGFTSECTVKDGTITIIEGEATMIFKK